MSPRRPPSAGEPDHAAPAEEPGDDVEELPLGPALEVMRQLWHLNHAIERVSSTMEKALGITAQQRMILRCVGRYPGMTAGQLAAQLHLDPGTISAALARMERRRLLVRRRDHRDRRRVTLGLTAAGRALDRPAGGTIEHAVERLLATANERDVEVTRRTLGALTRLLEDERTSPSTASETLPRTD